MLEVLLWWLLLELIGLAVLPLAFRFFRNLPDRGYAFTKPLGLLLVAYPFWLLTSLGFLTNTRGAILLVVIGVAALSWWLAGRPMTDDQRPITEDEPPSFVFRPPSFADWLRSNTSTILATELVFTFAFLLWVFVRAYMPEITFTEKPMEFAFLNGVLQSERFPPLDPWLSGYAISYYYFGYVIVAMLTLVSGIPSSMAFNLAIATLFALGTTGAYGVAYNLIRDSKFKIPTLSAMALSFFAPIFLTVVGNLESVFEILHNRGILPDDFWQWLDIKGLAQATVNGTWIPTDNWWWWRASRVVHDVIGGNSVEVIDEFPQFSFLLGDLHPHVLALPFVLLALAVALNLLNAKSQIPNLKSQQTLLGIWNLEFGIYPLVLGGLFFLNSWDILPYGFILVAAFAIARYRAESEWNTNVTRDVIFFAATLGIASILMYLPFFVSFQSQAGGILPTLFVKTRLHQYLIMFGLFVFLLGAWIIQLTREQTEMNLRAWFRRAAPFLAAAILFPLVVAGLALTILALTPALQDQARAAMPNASGNLLTLVLGAYFRPWIDDPWLFILLALFLASIVVLISLRIDDASVTFALLLALTGFLLTFGVEFVYLRDQFGSRMNTVFKFYFQAWTLFAIAGTYAMVYLLQSLRGLARGAWIVALTILLGASLIYPALAIPDRANGFRNPPTLDGIAWIRATNPDDHAAIEWLNANAPRGATILEAPGDEYSYGNRISMATGLPTVLGWAGHESQWRGNSKLYFDPSNGIDRAGDIQRIYQTLDTKDLLTLLDKYAIKFVVVGQSEKVKYGLAKAQIDKFAKVLQLVFENGNVRIYAR